MEARRLTTPIIVEAQPKKVLQTRSPEISILKESKPQEAIQLKKSEEVIPETRKTPEIKSENSLTVIQQVCRSIFDAAMRGPLRYCEQFIEQPILRGGFRFLSEVGRKSSEAAFVNTLNGSKGFTKNDFLCSLTRAAEHVPATLAIDSNQLVEYAPFFEKFAPFELAIPKVFAGFGNMAIRFATRFGLYKTGSVEREGLREKGILDELFSRSFFRAVYVNSDNPIISIGSRILEQSLINLNLHVFKPLTRLFPEVGDSVSNFIEKPSILEINTNAVEASKRS